MKHFSLIFYYLIWSLKILLIALGSLFLISLILFLLNFNTWQALANNGLEAKQNLASALTYLLEKDLDRAKQNSQLAKENLSQANLALDKIKEANFIYKLKFIRRELLYLEKIIGSGQIINSSFKQIIKLIEETDQIVDIINRHGPLSLADKEKIIETAFILEPELVALQANLNLVLYTLEKLENSHLLLMFKKPLLELGQHLEEAKIIVSRSLPVLRLLPSLGGWPDTSRFLILFQNNDELRPTGGFLGSYATLEISRLGEEINMQIGDIYHLDMPSIEYLDTVAPEPINRYMQVKKWYLRDANWSPDWPSAAAFIEWLFYQESFYAGQEFNDLDGIFAITPDLVADLLSLTGPINLDGELYTADNLQKLLQYQTGLAYQAEEIDSWDRKEIINDLALILKDRLQILPTNLLPELIMILDKAIVRKDLLTYFTHPNNQFLAEQLGSDGKIKQSNGDYLMIVDANLAAFKTDAVMIKDWHYQIESSQAGPVAKLSLNYQHQGGFDWRTTRYRSYTRVLAPLASQLLSIEGASDLSSQDDKSLDKTVFGFFFSVEPGQSHTINLSYLLPNRIEEQINQKNYQLYLQRQPGSRINSFNFKFLNKKQLTKDLESDKIIRIFD